MNKPPDDNGLLDDPDGGLSTGNTVTTMQSGAAGLEDIALFDAKQDDAEGQQFTATNVEPGLAALVVRQYLLPMFEGKKNRLDPSGGFGLLDEQQPSVAGGPQEGIFGELRLSDQLLDELQQTKLNMNDLRRKYASSEGARERLETQVGKFNNNIAEATTSLRQAQVREQTARQETAALESEILLLSHQKKELEQESRKLQTENAKLASRLLSEEGKVERLSQVVAQNQNTSSLSQLESDVLQSQVQNLHSRVAGLFGITKNLLDERSFNRAVHELNTKKVEMYTEKIWQELDRLTDERQKLEMDQEELNISKSNLEDHRTRLTSELDDQRLKNQAELVKMFDEKEIIRKERDKLSKKLKELTEDRDKLKRRMKKYRLRRLFDHETVMCRNCGKDFMKTENFNWSCRTHTSEFGGEMWWCCGKIGKDSLGCKFSKHESKDDDDDLDDKERREKEEVEQRIWNANVRCYGCKDIGHMAKNCVRDPNMRTKYSAQKELQRITQASNADASKKQLRENHGRAIAKLINDKIGFPLMADDIRDDERQPFSDLVELSRERVKQKKQKHAKTGRESSLLRGEAVPDITGDDGIKDRPTKLMIDPATSETFAWESESGGSTSESDNSSKSNGTSSLDSDVESFDFKAIKNATSRFLCWDDDV